MDFAGGGHVIEPTKKIVGPECKILTWFSAAMLSMVAIHAEYDFAAIAEEIYSDDTRRQGRSMDEILEQVYRFLKKEVFCV